jgi:hypothetical protein
MAHNRLRRDYLPKDYLKPPLHAYLHEFLVIAPVNQVVSGWFRFPRESQYPIRLLGSRLLTVGLFAAGVAMLYFSIAWAYGKSAAGCAALLYATSAGLLVFNRFLSVDSTLLFWMLASFSFSLSAARSGLARDAALAGLFAGLSAAAKYNGALIAVALPAALFVMRGWLAVIGRLVWIGAGASLIGFAVGNPGFVLDTARFFNDFVYNTVTTPIYDGSTVGHGYWKFLAAFPEILGWPGSILLAALLCVSLFFISSGRFDKHCRAVFFSALAFSLAYYALIGRFPRMPVRFALPVVPFLLIASAPGFLLVMNAPQVLRRIFAAGFALLLAYNVYSAWDVGMRFAGDARMAAVDWMRRNAFPGAVIESIYSPSWEKALPFPIKQRLLPAATGRYETFGRIFVANPSILESVKQFETPPAPEIHTVESLNARAPDFVTFSTLLFDWTADDNAQRFYQALEENRVPGWKKVFDGKSRERAPWAYPVDIDFLPKRMMIIRPVAATPGQ